MGRKYLEFARKFLYVMNNGAGEKAQKEEKNKEQGKPAAKPSLKTRLAEKKAQMAGQEHGDNIKNSRGRCKR